jgi:signal peptidase II
LKALRFFLIALAIILLDQVSKLIVKLNMRLGEEIPVLGDFFKIHFIENKGAAFGLTVTKLASVMGGDISEETGKLILSIFSIVAVIAIGYVLYRMATHRSPLPYFLALIFGGAMGNIIDRTFYGVWFSSINDYEGGLFHGRVVDMFYFDIWRGYLPDWIPMIGGDYYSLWPIFNIADSAISVGIVVILLFQGRFFSLDEKARMLEESASRSTAPGESTLSASGANPKPSED